MATSEEKLSFRDRLKQIGPAFSFVRRHDKLIIPLLLLTSLVPIAIGVGVALVTGDWLLTMPLAVALSLLLTLLVFTRRVARATYAEVEGKPGAAAAVLQNMRGNWRITPGVAATVQQDVVHRVVGPPGIVLVGEGSSQNRVKQLMVNERRKHERVAQGVPIHEVVCGRGEGEVPLPKLVRHVQKLGRSVKPAEMTDILQRLKALDAQRGKLPLPKGPVPTSMKGMRSQQRGR